MKTENSFHRTPQHIVDFVMSLTYNGRFLDLCSGDGALTNSEELESLVSIDINFNLLKKVKQGKKINANLLGFSDKNHEELKNKIIEDIGDFDYVLMNPPFENYKQFVDIALEIMESSDNSKGIFILPKKALSELNFNDFGVESKTVFNQVDFGTAIVDIVVIKVKIGTIRIYKKCEFLHKKSEIPNKFVNPNSAKFLSILEDFDFVLGASYKGTFIHDSYTLPNEQGKVEWRTDFMFSGDEYAISTFFEEEHTPTMDEIIRQVQDYLRLWAECFIIEKKPSSTILAYEKLDFCEHEKFLSDEIDIEICDKYLDYVGFETKTLDDYRKVSYRVYQDYKLFRLIEKGNVYIELLNVDFDAV